MNEGVFCFNNFVWSRYRLNFVAVFYCSIFVKSKECNQSNTPLMFLHWGFLYIFE